MKLKIKPSAKIKRRYILLEGCSRQEAEKVILNYIGILGWAKAGCVFVANVKELKKDHVVLAIWRKSLNDIRAAFEVSDSGINVLRISGTLNGLSK